MLSVRPPWYQTPNPPGALPEARRAEAIPLAALGISGVAWPRRVVLSVLDWIAGQPSAIPGGDVVRMEASGPSLAYANRFVQPEVGEPLLAFALRRVVYTR